MPSNMAIWVYIGIEVGAFRSKGLRCVRQRKAPLSFTKMTVLDEKKSTRETNFDIFF